MHRNYWSSLELAYLLIPPGSQADLLADWRSFDWTCDLKEAIQDKFRVRGARNELNSSHAQVLRDFAAPSDEPIEIPAKAAIQYLKLRGLSQETLPNYICDEIQESGTALTPAFAGKHSDSKKAPSAQKSKRKGGRPPSFPTSTLREFSALWCGPPRMPSIKTLLARHEDDLPAGIHEFAAGKRLNSCQVWVQKTQPCSVADAAKAALESCRKADLL